MCNKFISISLAINIEPVRPSTSTHFFILAHCVFEFDPPALQIALYSLYCRMSTFTLVHQCRTFTEYLYAVYLFLKSFFHIVIRRLQYIWFLYRLLWFFFIYIWVFSLWSDPPKSFQTPPGHRSPLLPSPCKHPSSERDASRQRMSRTKDNCDLDKHWGENIKAKVKSSFSSSVLRFTFNTTGTKSSSTSVSIGDVITWGGGGEGGGGRCSKRKLRGRVFYNQGSLKDPPHRKRRLY